MAGKLESLTANTLGNTAATPVFTSDCVSRVGIVARASPPICLMKHLNHRGSGALLALSLLLAALLILSALGYAVEGTPNTSRWRLVNDPFAGWSLLIVLGLGLALIRVGPEAAQCVNALLFVGMLLGLGLASSLFWDPWLPNILLLSALPVLRSARQTLLSSGQQAERQP